MLIPIMLATFSSGFLFGMLLMIFLGSPRS